MNKVWTACFVSIFLGCVAAPAGPQLTLEDLEDIWVSSPTVTTLTDALRARGCDFTPRGLLRTTSVENGREGGVAAGTITCTDGSNASYVLLASRPVGATTPFEVGASAVVRPPTFDASGALLPAAIPDVVSVDMQGNAWTAPLEGSLRDELQKALADLTMAQPASPAAGASAPLVGRSTEAACDGTSFCGAQWQNVANACQLALGNRFFVNANYRDTTPASCCNCMTNVMHCTEIIRHVGDVAVGCLRTLACAHRFPQVPGAWFDKPDPLDVDAACTELAIDTSSTSVEYCQTVYNATSAGPFDTSRYPNFSKMVRQLFSPAGVVMGIVALTGGDDGRALVGTAAGIIGIPNTITAATAGFTSNLDALAELRDSELGVGPGEQEYCERYVSYPPAGQAIAAPIFNCHSPMCALQNGTNDCYLPRLTCAGSSTSSCGANGSVSSSDLDLAQFDWGASFDQCCVDDLRAQYVDPANPLPTPYAIQTPLRAMPAPTTCMFWGPAPMQQPIPNTFADPTWNTCTYAPNSNEITGAAVRTVQCR